MRGHNPNEVLYLVLPTDLDDDSISRMNIEGRASFVNEASAIAYAETNVHQFGGEMTVFRCEPVKRFTGPDNPDD